MLCDTCEAGHKLTDCPIVGETHATEQINFVTSAFPP